MTSEKRQALKHLVDLRVRANVKAASEPRLGGQFSRFCSGCDVPHDEYTRGCRRCMNRHYHRKTTRRRREAAALALLNAPGVCTCGCAHEDQTWGCAPCRERHKKRRQRDQQERKAA